MSELHKIVPSIVFGDIRASHPYIGSCKEQGKQFGKGFKGSAKAFLAATSSVKSLIFLNPLQKSGDLGTKFYNVSVLL